MIVKLLVLVLALSFLALFVIVALGAFLLSKVWPVLVIVALAYVYDRVVRPARKPPPFRPPHR